MDRSELTLLKGLLRHQRLLALAVVVDGLPVAGVVPFLASPDLTSLAVHVSALTRHARGLGDDAPWSGVVHVPDSGSVDPLQVPRVLLQGESRRLEGDDILEAVRRKWVERFPSAEMTVDLGDFTFFSLDLAAGRLVAGPGEARNLSREHFAQAARL
jgi:putative heme iron utilization protein